ncbi:MAG: flagellar biosynthetic protein FliR [Planctomycetota bacterium]|jgi:flagellar biosynthetic protein FliR
MEPVINKILGFAMVLTRISAFFLVLPVFGWKSIPVRVKVAMTVLMAVFFSMITQFPFGGERISMLEAILLIASEAAYGFALGLIQMGLAMAQILDPLTGERTQPLGSLLEMIFIILFLSANGHHLLLMIISKSYQTFPVGSTPSIMTLVGGVVQAGSAMFVAGLRLAAPMLAAFMLLMVVLAVFARIVPEMNILFISLPLRVGLGLLMVAIFLPFISGFVAEFAGWMDKLLPL